MRIRFRVLHAAFTLAACLTALGAALDLTGPQVVLPVRVSEGAILLHGDWKFKYLPSSNVGSDDSFFQPAFDVSSWKTIPVPSHWELHGFAEPKYKRVDKGRGLYRRSFRVPAHWRGQRVSPSKP